MKSPPRAQLLSGLGSVFLQTEAEEGGKGALQAPGPQSAGQEGGGAPRRHPLGQATPQSPRGPSGRGPETQGWETDEGSALC